MGRLALAVWASVTAIAVGGVVSAPGAVQTSSGHGPNTRGFSAFAINPRNPQLVYAGSGSGVFKSTDGGASWQAVNAGLTERYVFDLAIDQRHPATLYAATQSGVFKSTNAGRTWQQTTGLTRIATVALALDPRNSRVVYAATDEGVYKSGDAGASWRKVTTDPHAIRVFALALDPRQPATVYAGSGGGVFKSTDGGRTWKARNVGLFPGGKANGHDLAEGFVSAIVVNPRRPQTLYLGCARGVLKSTNGARTWRRVHTGLSNSFSHVASLAIDSENPQTLHTGTYSAPGLFRTANGGRSWRAMGPPGKRYVSALALDPADPETVYVGMFDGGKAFKSTDGGRTWSALTIPVR
jgi:photosystem II stability/assembly factor-like uncharacterized protein